jgi:hypothetical protein
VSVATVARCARRRWTRPRCARPCCATRLPPIRHGLGNAHRGLMPTPTARTSHARPLEVVHVDCVRGPGDGLAVDPYVATAGDDSEREHVDPAEQVVRPERVLDLEERGPDPVAARPDGGAGRPVPQRQVDGAVEHGLTLDRAAELERVQRHERAVRVGELGRRPLPKLNLLHRHPPLSHELSRRWAKVRWSRGSSACPSWLNAAAACAVWQGSIPREGDRRKRPSSRHAVKISSAARVSTGSVAGTPSSASMRTLSRVLKGAPLSRSPSPVAPQVCAVVVAVRQDPLHVLTDAAVVRHHAAGPLVGMPLGASMRPLLRRRGSSA